MAENPKFNNSDMFKNIDSNDYSNITPDSTSEVLATQGNVINSIKTFWNKLRKKLAYAISRPEYSKQVGGNYVPIFVDADGVVRECQPTTIQADIADNGIITIPTNYIPNDNIYTGTTVCISVSNNSVSGLDSNLQIQHKDSISPVKYPSGVTVLTGDISSGDLLLATFCKNSNSSNNFWILLNKINTVVSTGQTTSNGSGNGGHPGLMTAEDKAKLDTIKWSANDYILPKATSDILGGIKLGYTTNDRKYKLETDDNGNGYVNVPWTVYSLPTANKDTLGGVKSSSNTDSDNNNKIYHVGVNTNGIMTVNVPWTDTTYTLPTATSSDKGGVKLGADKLNTLDTPVSTSDAGRYYPIQTDKNDKLVVNVPWQNTHNNAELRAGNNSSISNEATTNGNTYLKIVDGDSVSSLKILGSGGTEVKSDVFGNITITSQDYFVNLSSTNKDPSRKYTVKGAGYNANTNYYLAGNGSWVNGILVPVPTEEGKTLKSHADGTVYWG